MKLIFLSFVFFIYFIYSAQILGGLVKWFHGYGTFVVDGQQISI